MKTTEKISLATKYLKCASCILIIIFVAFSYISFATADTLYPVGFSWERNLDWINQSASDSDTTVGNPAPDTFGNPAWHYRWIDGGEPLTGTDPWHLKPSTKMVWSTNSQEEGNDGSWIRMSPAMNPSVSRLSLFHATSTFQHTPEVSWCNPTGRSLSIRITGLVRISWHSISFPPTPVDIAISHGTDTSIKRVLLTDSLSMPSQGDNTAQIPVDLYVNIGISESIRITARMQTPTEGMYASLQDKLTFTIVDGDLDGDGLPNTEEQELGTNANDQDSDNDGWSDQCEIEFFGNPVDPSKIPVFQAKITTNESGMEKSLRLPTNKSRNYFVEESESLANWLATGGVITGNGETVEIPIAINPGETRFFRGKSTPLILDPNIISYRNATGISEDSAEALNKMLSEFRSVGMDPDFFWIGGTRYNQSDQTRAIIGGTGQIVGAGTIAPIAETENSCRFNRGKFLQFDQPEVLRSTSVESLAIAVWFEELDYTQDSNILSTYDPLAKGPILQQLASGQTRLFTYPTATTLNPTAVFPVPTWSIKTQKRAQYYRVEKLSSTSTRVHALLDTNSMATDLTAVFNGHNKINIGGNSLTATQTHMPWTLSNCRVNAVVISKNGPKPRILETYPGSPISVTLADETHRITEAPYAAGILPRQDFPSVLTLGDSTTATKWNTYSFLTPPFAGSWMNNAVVDDYASGGSSMDFHVELTPYVENYLKSPAYGPKYLIYTPEGLLNQAAVILGLPENDETAWYEYTEEWLEGIKHRTNCIIALSSYIKGNTSDPDSGRNHRNRVRQMALDNNWYYIPMWEDPHSQVWTGSSPGSYGFYSDQIHQTVLGRQIQAEIYAAAVPHLLDTSSPRADLNNPPQLFGDFSTGSTVSCNTGKWFHFPTTYTYQWLRNLVEIPGATSSTYLIQSGDQGARLACRVVANKQNFRSASFTSAPSPTIDP